MFEKKTIFFLVSIACDNVFKLIFFVIGIKRILKINSNMKIDNNYLSLYSNVDNSILKKITKEKWTFCSMLKFIILKLIVLIYLSLIIVYVLNNELWNINNIIDLVFLTNYIFYIYCSINSITWIIFIRIYYKEFRIYKDQTWYGIRTFWILNSIIIIIEIIFIYYIINKQPIYDFPNIIFFILFSSVGILSFLLFLLAICHPYDISVKQKTIYSKNDTLNETQISTDFQDDLMSNSDENNENENFSDELNYKKLSKISIDISENIKYDIKLKIRTKDFSKLIFKLKIQNVNYIKAKNTTYVCNFNEIILKYYMNNNKSTNILNFIKQAYNISLTLNPKRNSFNGNKKYTNVLAILYLEIIKIDNEFLLNLINFLEINDDELINILNKKYISIYKQNPSINKEIERLDTSRSIFSNSEDSS